MDHPAIITGEPVKARAFVRPGSGGSSWWHPAWLAAFAVALAVGAHFAARWNLPMPQCMLRKLTGVPCPTCGCTRSLLAWSHGDLAEAFRFNPLFSTLLVGVFLWLLAWSVERLLRRNFLGPWRARTARWPWGRVFIVLAVVNWIYLCFNLPR